MTIALSYLDDLGRVRINLSALPTGLAHVERSTNGLYWETVRGGMAIPIVDGIAVLDDYEFPIGVELQYRVSVTPESELPTFVGAGSAVSNSNSTLSVLAGLPAGLAANDVLLILASAEVGDVNTPAGYTVLSSEGQIRLFGKIAGAAEPTPSISTTGGAAGGNIMAQTAAFRDSTNSVSDFQPSTGTSGQNTIPVPSLSVSVGGAALLQLGFRNVGWSGTPSAPSGSTRVGHVSVGTSAGQVWAYRIQTSAQDLPAGEFGNLNSSIGATWVSAALSLTPVGALSESSTITVNLEPCEVWLKSIRYPMLNQRVDIVDYGSLSQPGRVSSQWAQGRSKPVGMADQSGAFETDFTFGTIDTDSQRKLLLALSVGQIFYLQVTPDGDEQLPPRSMYLIAPNVDISRVGTGSRRHINVQFDECLKPKPRVVGTTLIWSNVWNEYADWTQLWNAEPSWRDLWDTVGSGEDLVVM